LGEFFSCPPHIFSSYTPFQILTICEYLKSKAENKKEAGEFMRYSPKNRKEEETILRRFGGKINAR